MVNLTYCPMSEALYIHMVNLTYRFMGGTIHMANLTYHPMSGACHIHIVSLIYRPMSGALHIRIANLTYDPLSHYLFILAADLLGRLVAKAESIGLLKGFVIMVALLSLSFNLRMILYFFFRLT